jgi:hypothetical protein
MPDDRLPALAGIARELEIAWKDTYVAGMWLSNLFEWLTWYSDCKEPPKSAYRAPSWSWASVDGTITFHWTGGTKYAAEILSCDVGRSTHGAYGKDAQGSLVLRATTVPLMAMEDVRNENMASAMDNYVRIIDYYDIEDDGSC